MAVALGGCAKDASQVGAAYVSPIIYESYTCTQLTEEAQRVSAKAVDLTGTQNQKATNDAVGMAVGVIVFWPALFMIKGNDETTAELARLKGTMDAIEQVSIKKQCGIIFQKPKPPEPPSHPAPGVT
jgi:hypothetical protein